MNVLLCGYHEAGYRILRSLAASGHNLLVATHAPTPDIPNVAELARAYAFETIVDDPAGLTLAARAFKPDVIFSVYFRDVIPDDVLALAPLGAFNFHPSLLPRHRGCFSAPWAIIDGDREAGVTCHVMTSRIDAGGIVAQHVVSVDQTDTGMTLYYKLVDATVALFPRVFEAIVECRVQTNPQTGADSYHPRRVPFDGVIDPTWSRAMIERFIRALHFPPYPPAVVLTGGARHEVRSLAAYDDVMARRNADAPPRSPLDGLPCGNVDTDFAASR